MWMWNMWSCSWAPHPDTCFLTWYSSYNQHKYLYGVHEVCDGVSVFLKGMDHKSSVSFFRWTVSTPVPEKIPLRQNLWGFHLQQYCYRTPIEPFRILRAAGNSPTRLQSVTQPFFNV